jgi:hypothetical protein
LAPESNSEKPSFPTGQHTREKRYPNIYATFETHLSRAGTPGTYRQVAGAQRFMLQCRKPGPRKGHPIVHEADATRPAF